jgi:hypothetical protein
MSATVRMLRWIEPRAGGRWPNEYWRRLTPAERLAAVLSLHREGNALFKGGNPPFRFELRTRHVGAG